MSGEGRRRSGCAWIVIIALGIVLSSVVGAFLLFVLGVLGAVLSVS